MLLILLFTKSSVYYSGIKSIRTSITGFPLPNPRSVSARVHKDIARPHRTDITFLFAAFGQLVDHDLTLTAETKGIFRDLNVRTTISETYRLYN